MDEIFGFILGTVLHGAWLYVTNSNWETEEEKAERLKKEASLREEAKEAEKRAAIASARRAAERLSAKGYIFHVTPDSLVDGYHVSEIGWLKCNCEERGEAEMQLRLTASQKYPKANVILKLTQGLKDEEYRAGQYSDGRPRTRKRKVKYWEALACLAVPLTEVDQSPRKWSDKINIVDGSNLLYWASDASPSLKTVIKVAESLLSKGVKPIVVFDANIGYKLSGRHLSLEEVKEMVGVSCDIEIVASGTVADRRIVELAELHSAPIVTNDLYRDSIKARHIPKRCGFCLFDDAEILPAR